MKILITGGAGFIGGNFCHYITNKYPDYIVHVLDSLTYAGNLHTLDRMENKTNFTFTRGDIVDTQLVNTLFENERFDVVVNFAAESHVDRSIENPAVFLKTNIIGTQVLMEASMKFGVKRFHQVSTDEVYGDLPLDRKDLFFTENSPITCSSPYSASKASADLLVYAYFKTFGLPMTISRCSNNYGPYHFPEKLIPLMIKNAIANQPLPVYGTGENVRDWLHVFDHCSAIDLIIHRGKIGETYNIGGNNERTNIEVVNDILKLLDKPSSLIRFVSDRKGHDLRYAIDSSKIREELGWTPVYDFSTGLIQTVKWFIDNQDWVSNVVSGEYQRFMDVNYKGIG